MAASSMTRVPASGPPLAGSVCPVFTAYSLAVGDSRGDAREDPDPRRVVREFVRASNAWDTQAILRVLAPDFVDHTPNPGQREGAEAFVHQKLGELRAAFPDVELAIDDELVEGHRIAWRWTLRGTNRGPFAGYPATGREVVFGGVNIDVVDGGRVVQHWSIYDSLQMLQQLKLFHWGEVASDSSTPN
jgi:steroid delta-isomerase-like uncharacterized protein